MAGRPKSDEVKKVAPMAYDPYSEIPPECFKGYVAKSKFCHSCKYAQECKKK